MTRTFIALELNEALQSHLAGVIRQVAQALPRVRWVDPSGIHLTLAFLGELDDAQLERAIEATTLAARQVQPFTYRLTRLDIFGSPRLPRVIWMGIEEDSGSLARLHSLLQHELARSGFETDKRPFSPHLTLARIKAPLVPDDQQRLQEILMGKQSGVVSPHGYTVEYVNVMKSELLRSGAHYTCLRACPLRAV
jgi:RNA 2',3'-cyclic 3'-phosphodiesterase